MSLRKGDDDDSDENMSRDRSRSKTPFNKPLKTPPKTSIQAQDEDSELDEIYNYSKLAKKDTQKQSEKLVIPRAVSPAFARVKSDLMAERAATPFLNQQNRCQCEGTTNKGTQCKNAAKPGSSKCHYHL